MPCAPTPDQALARELDARRVAAGLSVRALAERAHLPATTVRRVLAGERDVYSTQLRALLRALGEEMVVGHALGEVKP